MDSIPALIILGPVFTPLAMLTETGVMADEDRDGFNEALMQYRYQNWDAAEQQFMKLMEKSPFPDFYTVFLHRIQQFRSNPPGDDWDGVWVLTEK